MLQRLFSHLSFPLGLCTIFYSSVRRYGLSLSYYRIMPLLYFLCFAASLYSYSCHCFKCLREVSKNSSVYLFCNDCLLSWDYQDSFGVFSVISAHLYIVVLSCRCFWFTKVCSDFCPEPYEFSGRCGCCVCVSSCSACLLCSSDHSSVCSCQSSACTS